MDIRHLRYAEAVGRTLSFTRAARSLGISQPSLSIQIQHLEAELGARLFERDRRKLTITPAGRSFLATASRTLADLERATREIQDAATGRAGRVGLRVAEEAWSRLLEKALRRFLRKHRGVQLHLQETGSVEPWDLSVEAVLNPPPGATLLYRSPIGVALSPKHRLADKATIRASDLIGESLLISPLKRSAAEQWILTGQVPLEPIEIDSGRLTRMRMAAIGAGIFLCGCHETRGADVEIRPLDLPAAQLSIVSRVNAESHQPAAQVLLEFLIENCRVPAPPTP